MTIAYEMNSAKLGIGASIRVRKVVLLHACMFTIASVIMSSYVNNLAGKTLDCPQGFKIVGDNLDFQTNVRHMTETHQN